MQRRQVILEATALLALIMITGIKIIDGCMIPEKGMSFGDLALRSQVVVEATPTPNQLKRARRYAALFRVTKTFISKKGNLKVGGLFMSGGFGTDKECVRPIPGKRYIMFLKSSTRIVKRRPVHKIRYNPVPSSSRNIRFFTNVLAGKHQGKWILSSGCKKMPVPRNSKLVCLPGNGKCSKICNEGFKRTPGRTSRTCNSATGLWYPAKLAKCIKDQRTVSSTNDPVQFESRSLEKTKTPPGALIGKKGTRATEIKPEGHTGKKSTQVLPRRKTLDIKRPTTISPRPSFYKEQTVTTRPFHKNSATSSVSPSAMNNPLSYSKNDTNLYQNTSLSSTLLTSSTKPAATSPTTTLTMQDSTTIALSTVGESLIGTTTTARTRKPRPTLPTYRPLKPINSRPLFVPFRRSRQYDSNVHNPIPAEENNSGQPFRPARPPLPVYKPLSPLRNRRPSFSRRQIPTPVPRSVAILKVATPSEVIGEEIENVDDKFAVDRIGDEWQTDDGLTFKPELAVNQTVFGCPYYEANMTVFGSWHGGFNAMVKFERLPKPIMGGWMVRMEFHTPILDVQTHVVNFYLGTNDGMIVTFTPKPYMEILHVNQDLTVAFVARTDPSLAVAPSAKGFLLGKCTDEEIAGRAVGSMFQGKTVVDGYGPDSRSQDIPLVPTTESTTTVITTSSTTTTSTTTKQSTSAQSRPRAPGRIRSVSRPRSLAQSKQTSRPKSTNTRLSGNWLTNRCLSTSPNGVLPVGGTTRPRWKASKQKAKYDYNELLHKSNLFYLAQKSGKLPKKFPIPWRGDSALKDGCMSGHQLYGGLYSGGGHEKSTIAIAFTTTMLAWGAIDYQAAYKEAGEYNNVVKLIKENARYLIRCHITNEELIVQVGNYESSGSSWARPEEMIENGRTIHKITPRKPGQDVAAETAAALAATSILLKSSDTKLSHECLKHAKELEVFARKYPGPYSRSIPRNVNNYHTMSTTLDNLAWSELWLGKATNIQTYYKRAEVLYSKLASRKVEKFDWSEKTNAIPILLTKFAKKKNYNGRGKTVINLYREKAKKSDKKQLWIGPRGTNMLAANAAFLALQVAQLNKGKGYATVATRFAEEQLHLLLGDSGRSYVVGFGKNFPKRPRHMASSCRDIPARCDNAVLRISSDSPHTLHGALVGGPNKNGRYNDLITSKLRNEVAIDFNAGFQSAVAGLKQSKMPGKSFLSNNAVSTIQRIGPPVRKNG